MAFLVGDLEYFIEDESYQLAALAITTTFATTSVFVVMATPALSVLVTAPSLLVMFVLVISPVLSY